MLSSGWDGSDLVPGAASQLRRFVWAAGGSCPGGDCATAGCVDYAVEAFAPMPPGCPRSFYQAVGVPHACVPAFRLSYAFVGVTRCMVAASCLLAIWLQRVCRLRAPSVGQRLGGVDRGAQPPGVAGDGGRGVAAMLCSMLVIMTTVTAVYIADALPDSTGRSATGASWDEYACAMCTDYSAATSAFPSREAAVSECASTGKATALNMCFATWHARMPMMLISGHVSSLAMVTVLRTPLRVWGAVAMDAGEATGQRWLHVLHILRLLLIPAVVQCFIPFFALFAMEFYVAPRLLVEVSGYSSVVFVGPEVALSLWFLWAGRQNRRAGNAVAPGGPVTDAPRASAGKGLRQRVWAACRAVYYL
eukprot:jgi/Tetstr1/425092/TSEL_015556.t1